MGVFPTSAGIHDNGVRMCYYIGRYVSGGRWWHSQPAAYRRSLSHSPQRSLGPAWSSEVVI
jgi:hypothetical protein